MQKTLPVAAPEALGMLKICIHLTTKMYTKDLTELQECSEPVLCPMLRLLLVSSSSNQLLWLKAAPFQQATV